MTDLAQLNRIAALLGPDWTAIEHNGQERLVRTSSVELKAQKQL